MKISNSKKQLARIISENGGWRDGAEWAAQGGNYGHIGFTSVAPVRNGKVWDMARGFAGKFLADELLPNWHQTVLSRDEYFHLYPAPDTDGWIEWSGGMFAPVIGSVVVDVMYANGAIGFEVNGDSVVWEHKKTPRDYTKVVAYRPHKPESGVETPEPGPTIEQLAADYRNLRDIAERKQKDADSAKAEANAKLGELDRAGKALGLIIGIVKDEPVKSDLNITDWRDLKVNDLIKITSVHERGNDKYYSVIGLEALVVRVGDPHHQDLEVMPANSGATLLIDGFEFIRRP